MYVKTHPDNQLFRSYLTFQHSLVQFQTFSSTVYGETPLVHCISIFSPQIFKHKEKIQEISTKASNEATLEIMLEKV